MNAGHLSQHERIALAQYFEALEPDERKRYLSKASFQTAHDLREGLILMHARMRKAKEGRK
jgi:hypothetical protein